MKGQVISLGAALATAVAAAVPQATVTGLALNETTGFVTVDYTLTTSAVVTVDFQVKCGDGDWVSLGAENFLSLSGDVNRRIEATGGRNGHIQWQAFGDGCGQRLAVGDFRAVLATWPLNSPPPYMVVDLIATNTVRYYVSTNAIPGGVLDPQYRQTSILMRNIPCAGREWRMGLGAGEWEAAYGGNRESPHRVRLSSDFYIAVFPLTQMQCLAVANNGGGFVDRLDWQMRPRESLTYASLRGNDDWPTSAEIGDGILKTFREFTGVTFDIPLDAQYEFACRADTSSQLYAEAYSAQLHEGTGAAFKTNVLRNIAWIKDWSGGETHPVGLLQPNGYGLYDMIGNVRCRCRDWYVEDLRTLGDAAYLDPVGPDSNSSGYRVSRGCSYSENGIVESRTSYRAPDSSSANGSTLGTRFVAPAIAEM